jgi:rhodanese-related sulfurtransferase
LRLPKPDWDEIHAWLRKHFSDVRHLSVDELQAWRGDPSRTQPVLVDIRSDPEQSVSRIGGACLTRSEADAMAKLGALPRDTPIVTYCAVGLRSANLARELGKAGFRDVHNFEGSIFAWANRGLPLEGSAGPATGVHPYDDHWGVLLDAAHHETKRRA